MATRLIRSLRFSTESSLYSACYAFQPSPCRSKAYIYARATAICRAFSAAPAAAISAAAAHDMDPNRLRNVAVIAHVDHGKTTLMDRLLRQCGADIPHERALDSISLERERGITISSKVTSILWNGNELNMVDTPGHADFGGEVERVVGMVEGAILVVDAGEGPLAQTKFVLAKALKYNIRPILLLNKVDRPSVSEERCDEVESLVFDLFANLGATEEQLDFPVLYASAKEGWASYTFTKKPPDDAKNMAHLLDAIIRHVPPPTASLDAPFKMLVSMMERDFYLGRILTGRINSGVVRLGDRIHGIRGTDAGVVKIEEGKVTKLMKQRGTSLFLVDFAVAGDIISMSGLTSPSIGHTVSNVEDMTPMPTVELDPPTISMTFGVNDSPLAGKDGTHGQSSKQQPLKLCTNLIKITSLELSEDKKQLMSGTKFAAIATISNKKESSSTLPLWLAEVYDEEKNIFFFNDRVSFSFCPKEVANVLGISDTNGINYEDFVKTNLNIPPKVPESVFELRRKLGLENNKVLKAPDYRKTISKMPVEEEKDQYLFKQLMCYYILENFLMCGNNAKSPRAKTWKLVADLDVFDSVDWAGAAHQHLMNSFSELKKDLDEDKDKEPKKQHSFMGCTPILEAILFKRVPALVPESKIMNLNPPIQKYGPIRKEYEAWKDSLSSLRELTGGKIGDRLMAEAETNLAINVIPGLSESYEVQGRGELQLGILIENMRREGFELSVSPPKVMYKNEKNVKLEPIEEVTIEVHDEHVGLVMEALSHRKGEVVDMGAVPGNFGRTRLSLTCPSRGLVGYRSVFSSHTRGTGFMHRAFMTYEKHRGPLGNVRKGVLVSVGRGPITAYALLSLEPRGTLFVHPGMEAYDGMIVGEHSRDTDLDVNPVRSKELNNIRSANKDETVKLSPPRMMNLEEAIGYVASDELIEVTPKAIRLRKRYLDANKRRQTRNRTKD